MKRRDASARQPGGKNIILIAVTGHRQEEDRRRSFEAGFDYHLVNFPSSTVDYLSSMLLCESGNLY